MTTPTSRSCISTEQKLFYGALCLHICMLPLLFFLPIYTDEIAYKMVHARDILDGGGLGTVYPQCFENQSRSLLTIFWPFRFLNHLLFGWHFSPLAMRLLSCLQLLAIAGLVTYLVKRITQRRMFGFVSAWLLCGLIPFTLSLSRPEFFILLFMLLSLCFGYEALQKSSRWSTATIMLGLTTCFVALLSYHPKTIFFAPYIFLVILLAHTKLSWKILTLVLNLIIAGFSIRYILQQQMSCTSETVRLSLGELALSPGAFLHNPVEWLTQFLHNLGNFGRYLRGVHFKAAYMSHWLPPSTYFHPITQFFNKLLAILLYTSLAVLTMGFLSSCKAILQRRHHAIALMIVSIMIFLTALGGIQTTKNAYESSLVLPLILLGALLSLQQLQWWQHKAFYYFRIFAFLLALYSTAIAAVSVRSPFLEWFSANELGFQPHSFTVRYYSQHKTDALALYKTCQLPAPIDSARHLVIDDVTYGYFYRSQEPYHILYLTGKWEESLNTSLLEYLRSKGSSGILTRCNRLPDDVKNQATQQGPFCCLKL